MVKVSSNEWFKMLLDEKDKRISERDMIILHKDTHIIFWEEKLINLGML